VTATASADITLRRASPRDAAAVRDLTRRAYAPWRDLIGREPLPMAADHAAAIRDHVVDLAERAGELLGVVEMIPRDGDLLVENLAVAPPAQGLGLGTRLLAHAEAEARGRTLSALRLYTNARFEANLRFYARRGYVEERREAFAGGFVVHMVRRLEGEAWP